MDKEEESSKQTPRKLPDLSQFERANSDNLALALAMQEQQDTTNCPTNLSTIEDNDNEEEEDEEGEEDNDYEYFESQEFEDYELDGFLEEQDSNYNTDGDYMMEEEDEIDPDELSYEELIALGEFIGAEKRGMSVNEIGSCLKEFRFDSCRGIRNEIDRCVVCQIEYEEGECISVLLPCHHPYHSECITKWLQVKKVCPICGIEAKPNGC